MKNKVIAHLDQYRDKTMSRGAVVQHSHGLVAISQVIDGLLYSHSFLHKTKEELEDKGWKIIGHPITHADLLRALRDTTCWTQWRMTLLEDKYQLNYHEVKVADRGSVTRMIIIPLNYPNVEAIPSDHPMWEQLGKVFNLTTPDHE